ncbi:MAG: ABC transporter substrate-binding protein [Pirellulaceae bacterium]
MNPRVLFPQLWILAALASGLLLAAAPRTALAQADEVVGGKRIFEREPFDKITCTQAFEMEVILVSPIQFPNRQVPTKHKAGEKLRVQPLDIDEPKDIPWTAIEKVELFEQMVLAEANTLVAAGRLDDAFDFFRYLKRNYEKMDGLPQAHQNYLYQCVASAAKSMNFDEALGIVEELYAQNPRFKPTESSREPLALIGFLAEKIISGYIAKEDFRSAKTLLRRLETKYNAGDEPFVKTMRGKLSDVAAKHRDDSKAQLAAGKFVEAYDACARMIDIWPYVDGGAELAAEIARRYPLVMVGVSQPALSFDPRSLINPAARRTGRLMERRLMEFVGRGPEGGKYTCSLGTVKRSDDGLRLTFTIDGQALASSNSPLSGYDVSRHLLDLADPASPFYQPPWARLADTIQVRSVSRVEANLRMPHILPEAFLQTSYLRDANLGQPGVKGSGPYFLLSRQDTITRFSKNENYPLALPGQPAEVMERFYSDPQRALLALQRGEVDVLDQIFPADIPTLASEEIAIGRYSVPTTHLLTISRKHPYLQNAEFRRALVYGCNREAILNKGLMKDAKLPGFRTVSGPFPAPVDAADALCYGYDNSLEAMPYEPRLAMILKAMATRLLKSQAEKLMQKPPELTPLVLGHPNDEVSRLACRALGRQWDAIGIKSKLIEFPPGVFVDEKGECDLVYVQAATWEPATDAARLFASWGLNPANNTYVSLELRNIENAKDWREARNALLKLHRLVYDDVTVIPLYQTFDYYAYRKSVKGIVEGPATLSTLYQNIEKWQAAPRFTAP